MTTTKTLLDGSPRDVSLCIETVSGMLVNPSNPSPDDIRVDDIAWALSRIPRFAGHTITETSYNVAQHSIYVSELLEDLFSGKLDEIVTEAVKGDLANIRTMAPNTANVLIQALFHDGHEAYFGDIPSPIKKIPELTATFKSLEAKLDKAIFGHIKVPLPNATEKAAIKFCDKIAQAIEGYQFMPSRGRNWDLPVPTLIMIQKFPHPMTPLASYQAFLNRYHYLARQ